MKLAVFATLATSAAAFSVSPQKAAQAAAVSAAVAASAASPAFADVDNGRTIFNANCSACHVGGQNVIMPEKTLEKEALESYLAGGRNKEAIMNQVTNGKNAMPAFGGRLEDTQIADVADYVFTISGTEGGWDDE